MKLDYLRQFRKELSRLITVGTITHFLAIVLIISVSMAFLANCSILPGLSPGPLTGPKLQLHVINVGYGESLLLTISDGSTVLWDAGYPEQGENVVAWLRAAGVETINLVVTSHPHPDHIGGLPAIMNSFPIEKMIGAFPLEHNAVPDIFRETLGQCDIPYYIVRKGDTQTIGRFCQLTILNPEKLVADLNDSSLVAMITLGTTRILLSADIGPVVQRRLIENNQGILSAHVMTVPHHGGRSYLPFFDAVGPDFALLSVGPNPWGNPKDETIEYLRHLEENNSLSFYRTDEYGPIVIECNDRGGCTTLKEDM